MDQDIVLEFESHFQARVGHEVASTFNPNSRKVHRKDRKGQPMNRHHFRLDDDLRELDRSYSSGLHYESMHSGTLGANGDNEVLKRGSMYQSSKDVWRMRKLQEERRKLKSGCSDDAFISFEIIDHFPQHGTKKVNQLPNQKFLPLACLSTDSKPTSANKVSSITSSSMEFLDLSFRDLLDEPLNTNAFCSNFISEESCLVDDLLEVCLPSVDTRTHCTKAAPWLIQAGHLKEQKSNCHEKIGLKNHGKIICERDSMNTLPKCFSESAKMSRTVSQLKYDSAEARGHKTMFNPLKRMFDPIMKSKSVQVSPQSAGGTVIDPRNTGGIGMFHKTLPNEFPIREQNIEHGACLMEGELLAAAVSPAHLHGILKLDIENGNRSSEFSLDDPKDVLSAKTWKTDNAFNWVYTFHSSKKKMNSTRETKDKHGQTNPLVGQMQVSCYLCSEVRENGSLANSTVTEFVLYDIARARSFAVEERYKCSADSIQPASSNVVEDQVKPGSLERNNSVELHDPARHGFSSCDSNVSTSYPWSPVDLHPQLEVAAIVIQIPFNRKESPKDMKEFSPKENQILSRFPAAEQGREAKKRQNPAIINVVTPSGTHGLPNTNEGGPSSLLDRWRFGGGCDCGGWDMACPIVVFDNHHADDWTHHLSWKYQKPMWLFVQGSKEKVPALSIMADGKGQYSVDFHAQFSALQAFSICIAILHSSEVSSAVTQEKSIHRLYSNSLKLLLEEEVRQLIEAAATEEQRKAKEEIEQTPPSFFLDPPFSPIGRV